MTKSSREFFPVVATVAAALIVVGFVSMASAPPPGNAVSTASGQIKIQCFSGSVDDLRARSNTCTQTA